MNRPRIVGMLSAALGSTAGFLILSRWSLAGTITGAILMPVIFTLVSFGSHETMERTGKWFVRRVKKDRSETEADLAATEETDTHSTGTIKPRTRGLQWSVAILALLAFSFSLYTLAQDRRTEVTILHEKVIETVTVTTEQPTFSVARAADLSSSTTTVSPATTEEPSTTTTVSAQQDTTTTTDPSAQDGTPTTAAPTTAPSESTTTTLP